MLYGGKLTLDVCEACAKSGRITWIAVIAQNRARHDDFSVKNGNCEFQLNGDGY